MEERQIRAYRRLLYWAMLDIRMLCQSRGRRLLSPLEWRRQYDRSRTAGAIADWLHNLALYASGTLEEFNCNHFWKEYDGVCATHAKYVGAERIFDYRKRFMQALDDTLIQRKG